MKQVSPLIVASINSIPVRLDFRIGVAHSLAARNFSSNVIVHAESTGALSGYGECVPRDYVTGENVDSVLAFLDSVFPQLEGTSFDVPSELISYLENTGTSSEGLRNPAAVCALELALLDLAGKHWNMSVYELIGLSPVKDTLVYSLIVPLFPDDKLGAFLHTARLFGFSNVKVKIDGDSHISRVEKVRECLGSVPQYRVDANGSLDYGNMKAIAASLKEIGVVSIEQPFVTDAYDKSAELRALNIMDVVLDESICNADDVLKAAELQACDMVNVRISKCGGLLGSLRVIRTARDRGLKIQLGAQVGESCVLSAAGAHLASACDDFVWLEGCFGSHLLLDDLSDTSVQFDGEGKMTAPRGCGLGIEISEDRIDAAHKRFTKLSK